MKKYIIMSLQINSQDVDYFTLENEFFDCKIVKVYGGNIVHTVFSYFGKLYKQK